MARNLFGDNPFNSRRAGFILGGGGNSQEEDDPLLTAIRKQGLFQRPGVQPMNSSAVTQRDVEPKVDPFAQALERMRGGQAGTAYREHIGKMPTREAYAPSQTRRIGGALAAAAGAFNNPKMGAEIGDQIINAPYRNALESWQMKGAGLKEQADIESQDVKSQIEWVKRMQDQQRAEAVESRDIRRLELDEERARTDKMYRQAQIDNFANQGWVKDTDAQGNTVMIHPSTGEQRNFGPSIEGRKVANTERATNISAGQLGVSQGNLGMRGQEFNYKMGQDAINNALNERRVATGERGAATGEYRADIAAQNAGAAGFVNAGETFTANAMAAQEVARTNPRFQGWSLDETGMPVKPGAMWGTNPVDPTGQDAKDYLAEVERAKGAILGIRRPGVGAPPGRRVTPPNLGGMGQGPIKFSDLPKGGGLKF